MRFLDAFLVLILCGCILFPTHAAEAQEEGDWLEARTISFAVVYPRNFDSLALLIISLYGESLDEEYQRFASFYQTDLQLPISIRIYPTIEDYESLNALAPQISEKTTHSHIGSREIALIGENIITDLNSWQQTGLNGLRFELAMLFVEQITNKKAQPGLLAGMGGYAQDPANVIAGWKTTSGENLPLEITWRLLWENPSAYLEPETLFLNTSIVAYLVDVYSWQKFLEFLESLRTARGYRQALMDIYDVEISTLEGEWREYFPLYIQGRWRSHALYDFDLSPFESMIALGAYQDAEDGLNQTIEYLESIDEVVIAEEAQALLLTAQLGKEAGILVSRSRQALQNRQYQRSIEFSQGAKELYEQIGATQRLKEVENYQTWAQEVLDLSAELDDLGQQIASTGADAETVSQLVEVGMRLDELDNPQGATQARLLLKEIEIRQQNQYRITIIISVLLAVILLGVRIWMARHYPPVEAQL